MRRVLSILKGGGKSYYDSAGNDQEREGRRTSSPGQPTTRAEDVGSSQGAPSKSPGSVSSFPAGIAVWHDCPDATVDICFVHGLTGNRESTWTAQGQSLPWPKTLLPSNLRKARLLTYGYDAYVVRKSAVSSNRLIDHASNLLNDLCNVSTRPLILVCHSLGGLVCKKTVLLSQNNPEPHLRGVFDRIVGVAFMGTPHKGSWMANWARIPASAVGLFKSSNKSLLETLETDNQLIEMIQVDFLSMVRGVREGGRSLEVVCFFEELPQSPVAGHVVSKESATIDGYRSISIHANHRDMTRFASTEDAGFQRLLGELTRWERSVAVPSSTGHPVGTATTHPPANAVKKGTIQPSYYIPFPSNRRFVGREETLGQLKEVFTNNDSQKAAVVGLGGVGKTQVALRFAYWVRETKPEYSVFWVPVLSQATFEQACVEIARQLQIPKSADDEDPKALLRRYLSSKEAGPWLLVVDNVDDMDSFSGIDQYLPESERGWILFTTRSREVALSAVGSDVVELSGMSPHESMGLLEKSLIQKDLLHDNLVTSELLKELEYLPLAIAQAAAYLNRNQVSITTYTRLLQATEQDMVSLMSRGFHDNTRYVGSQNAVATTWLVSFDEIRKSDPPAADLLSFMSCIEPKAIPRSILPPLESVEQMVHALGTLHAYAFVAKRGAEEVFDMHSLVHLATRIWVEREDLAVKTAEQAMRHLNVVFPTSDYKNRDLWREYLPHALRMIRGQGPNIKEKYNLYSRVGKCLLADGRTREAIICHEESFRWRKAHFTHGHPSQLASQSALADSYLADGQVKKAVTLLEETVVGMESLLAEGSPNLLESQYALARAYETDGHIEEAVKLLELILAAGEEVSIQQHPSWLVSQHALAGAYLLDGQTKKTVRLLKRNVAIIGKVLPENHLYLLNSRHELARAYLANGQVTEGLEILEHVVAVKANTFAEDHHDRLISQHELASAYVADGRITEAIELLEHVVKIKAKTLTEDHPSQLSSQHLLASAYINDGRVTEAVKLLEHVVAIGGKTFAEDRLVRLDSQHSLAAAYIANGQLAEAVKLLEHVVAIEAKTLAEDNPSRLATERRLERLRKKVYGKS